MEFLRLPRARLLGCVLVAFAAACGDPADPAKLLPRIDKSIAAQEWRAAAIDLKTLLQRHPENQSARLRLGQVAVELGDFETAIQELDDAQKRGAPASEIAIPYARALFGLRRFQPLLDRTDPLSVEDPAQRVILWTLRGEAQLALERPKDALASFDAALAISPADLDASIDRAYAVMDVEGLAAALRALEAMQKAHPNDPRVVNAVGGIYLRARDFARAEAAFGSVVRAMKEGDSDFESVSALAGLAEAQLGLSNIDAAQGTTLRLLERAPGNVDAILLRVRYLFLSDHYDEAKTLLEQILAHDERNLRARALLGAVNFAEGAFGQADMHLSSVLVADPANEFVRLLLATTRVHESKLGAALETLQPSVDEGDPAALSLAGQASMLSGNTDSGLALLERSVAEKPADAELTLQLAAGYLAAGRMDQAVRMLERVPAEGTASYRRSLLLVNAHLRSRDMKAALREGKSLAARNPDNALARATYGGLLAVTGSIKEARAEFERAAQLEPKNVAALVNLARLDMMDERAEQARKRLRQAYEINPKSVPVLVALAQFEFRGNRAEAGAKYLQAARVADPASVEPRVLLAQYHLSRSDFASAATLASEALRIEPDDARALNVLGLAMSGSGKGSEGVATLRGAAERNPASALAQFSLAQAYAAAGRVPEAFTAIEASLALQPANPASLTLAAAISGQRGDARGAKRYLDRLRTVDPSHPGLFIIGGDLAMQTGDAGGAAKLYAEGRKQKDSHLLAVREFAARRAGKLPNPTQPLEEWLQHSPNDVRARLILAQTQQQAGTLQDARKSYEAIVAANARHGVALNNLALLYFQLEDARALETARRAYELMPDTAAVADTYGWIALHAGDVALAERVLGQAAEKALDSSEIQYHRAVALARAGKVDAARDALRRLLANSRPFAERDSAQQLLASLERSG